MLNAVASKAVAVTQAQTQSNKEYMNDPD